MKSTFYIVVALLLSSCFAGQSSDDPDVLDIESQIIDLGWEDYALALSRTDSLEQSGKFSAARADEARAIVCMNNERNRLAYYYAERAMKTAIESGREDETDIAPSVKRVMSDCKLKNGEYGKAIRIANELLQDYDGDTSDMALTLRATAYSLIAECNDGLKNNSEAEKYYLASIKTILDGFPNPEIEDEVEPMFYNAATLILFYIDNSQYEKALPLVPMLDTAICRMERCPDVSDFDLLTTTKDSVALIAEMSGFSRSSFYRVFSEAYSMSPADYRKISKKH